MISFLLLVCTGIFLGACSPDEPSSEGNVTLRSFVTATYDASHIPGFPWLVEGDGIITLINNTLVIDTNRSLVYLTTWENSREEGFFIQARLRIEEAREQQAMGIYFSDKDFERYLSFYEDKIALHDQTRSQSHIYAMDTTHSFHTYGISVINDTLEVYVDGEFKFSAVFTKIATNKPHTLSFGSHNPDAPGKASWDHIQFGKLHLQ